MKIEASGLTIGTWIAVFIVGIIAAKVAKRFNWKTILWPLKKTKKAVDEEVKTVKEEWDGIE